MNPLETPATTWIGSLSRSQLVVRSLVVVGPVIALLATGPAGRWAPWWVVLAVLWASVAFAVLPDSAVGVGALAIVLAWWSAAVHDGLHPTVLVAAVALLITQVAAILASYGPGEMPVPAPLVRLWVRRAALVALVVPLVWGLARLVAGEPAQPGIWVLGTTVALAATVVGGVSLTSGPARLEKS